MGDAADIAERVAAIRRRMEQAAREAGRPGALLVAAAKTADAGAVRAAVAAGVDAVGENRVQEMLAKDAQGAYAGAPLHFIGRLQRNKVAKLVGRVALLQSVDSPALAEAVDAQAEKTGRRQAVLLEVNVGGEATKSGWTPEALWTSLESLSSLRHIQIRGLMCIPPPRAAIGGTQYFVVMRQLYIDIGRKNIDNIGMDILSMGMSDDFEEAVRAGATMVRVGSALFGPRT
ncbi:MAG: YggS family pyridoxal phosphate-dependent enzyme [Oscillospiraceae bacterium]|nr:YggS family pyridoxal phosphate-dependent enzyme [Oscillospiraceae bacterium]